MWALAILLVTLLYPTVLYPALLRFLMRARKKAEPGPGPVEWPSVALVICALNEEKMIRQKIENSLTLDYPRPLRIVLISDGSTDATVSIAREYVSRGLDLIVRGQRRGKVVNVNEVVSSLEEEVVVLSDANVIYHQDAIVRLVSRMADPTVGAVSGKVVLRGTTEDLRNSEELYYSIEWALQEGASTLYSMVGADGAMYAFRRKLFQPCPNDTIIEDLVIPLSIVRKGFRVLFEPRAEAWETGVLSWEEEFRRKTRIAAGVAQAMLRGNLWPWGAPARFWFVFISHKLLRWLTPVIGLAVLALALVTWTSLWSQLLLAGALALAAMAALRYLFAWSNPVLDAAFYFILGQVALLWGLVKGATGRQSVLWAKANR